MKRMTTTPEMCALVTGPDDICPCVMEGLLRFLGKSWNIILLGTLGNHSRLRYNELKDKLGRISPKTLSTRLRELTDAGLVGRRAYAEVPPRVEYELTSRGKELYRRLLPLLEWVIDSEHGGQEMLGKDS